MKKRTKTPDAEQMLRLREAEAVEAMDHALRCVGLLAEARGENQLSTSRVRAVVKEMTELRKVLAVYIAASEVADRPSTEN